MVMIYSQEQVGIIQDMINKTLARRERMGTVIERDPGWEEGGSYPGQHLATVVMDGDSVAIPVFCPGTVRARPGDRVGIIQWGADWVIAFSFGKAGGGTVSHFPTWGWGSTVTSADSTNVTTYETLSTMSTNFGKEHDWLWLKIDLSLSMFVQSVNPGTEVMIGVRFTSQTTGTVTDLDVTSFWFNQATLHQTIVGSALTAFVPPDQYTAQLIWKRIGTGGQLVVDGEDRYALTLQERPVPYYSQDT